MLNCWFTAFTKENLDTIVPSSGDTNLPFSPSISTMNELENARHHCILHALLGTSKQSRRQFPLSYMCCGIGTQTYEGREHELSNCGRVPDIARFPTSVLDDSVESMWSGTAQSALPWPTHGETFPFRTAFVSLPRNLHPAQTYGIRGTRYMRTKREIF
jgi:hypothetical protein